jgi:hypothetical protein
MYEGRIRRSVLSCNACCALLIVLVIPFLIPALTLLKAQSYFISAWTSTFDIRLPLTLRLGSTTYSFTLGNLR